MNEKYAEEILTSLFQQARIQFGNAVRSHWFYGHDACPGCGFEVDSFERDGETLVSINAFIHRERGVLIGYFLCSSCVREVQTAARRGPLQKSPVHDSIETTLVDAYHRHLGLLDA